MIVSIVVSYSLLFLISIFSVLLVRSISPLVWSDEEKGCLFVRRVKTFPSFSPFLLYPEFKSPLPKKARRSGPDLVPDPRPPSILRDSLSWYPDGTNKTILLGDPMG